MAKQSSNQDYHRLRSGLTLYPAQFTALDQTLADLSQKLPAQFVVLTDVSGQLVAARGDQGRINLVALGSLIAADLAASQEIAHLIGEYQDYQMVLREGRNAHTFITEAGHHLALLVQISSEVPLGWARMVIRQAAYQLAEVVASVSSGSVESELSASVESLLNEAALPDLFSDALDDLWTE
jgi:predicted regulator of Ras-like GTPase activity (Roadblock/LC7/MglB family)